MSLLLALLLAQAAPACAAMDRDLPAPLAGWTRPGDALALGGAVVLPTVDGAASVAFRVERSGVYEIALDQKGWIDVAPVGGEPLESVAHGHGPACSTIAKLVGFRLERGEYRISLSKLTKPMARVMLVSRRRVSASLDAGSR